MGMRLDRWVKEAHLARWLRRVDILFCLSAFVLIASLLLGGATHGGFLSDTVLEFTAIPLLLVALWRLFDSPSTKEIRLAVMFCVALAALPLLQLIPLPPWFWTALPNRGPSAAPFELLRQHIPWMPLSVSPEETWMSLLALIAPIALFLGTLQLSYRDRRRLSVVLLAVGTISVFVGLLQVAQGPNSPWRFFEFTNPTEAVGFFANRNHFAALLYALILFAAAWTVHASLRSDKKPMRGPDAALLIGIIGGFTLLAVLIAGEAMARSRAGLILTIIALFGAFSLGLSDRRTRPGITPNKVLVASVALAVIFAVQYALYRILERFDVDPLADARIDFGRHTVEAAKAYMPIGAGMGSFVPVYALFETPAGTLANTFANHAHNDVFEFWLEGGAFALALMACFAVWFVYRSVRIWQKPPAEASALDWSLARAATIVIALLIAHSFVDYPLRTGGMAAVMAFACALLIAPLVAIAPDREPEPSFVVRRERRNKPSSASLSAKPAVPPTSQSSVPLKSWDEEIVWPKEWKSDPKAPPSDDASEP